MKKKSKKGLAQMPSGVIKPEEDRRIEFTDIYGETHKGQYIASEDMFFIGFALTGDFRFSNQIHNWKYIKC